MRYFLLVILFVLLVLSGIWLGQCRLMPESQPIQVEQDRRELPTVLQPNSGSPFRSFRRTPTYQIIQPRTVRRHRTATETRKAVITAPASLDTTQVDVAGVLVDKVTGLPLVTPSNDGLQLHVVRDGRVDVFTYASPTPQRRVFAEVSAGYSVSGLARLQAVAGMPVGARFKVYAGYGVLSTEDVVGFSRRGFVAGARVDLVQLSIGAMRAGLVAEVQVQQLEADQRLMAATVGVEAQWKQLGFRLEAGLEQVHHFTAEATSANFDVNAGLQSGIGGRLFFTF